MAACHVRPEELAAVLRAFASDRLLTVQWQQGLVRSLRVWEPCGQA